MAQRADPFDIDMSNTHNTMFSDEPERIIAESGSGELKAAYSCGSFFYYVEESPHLLRIVAGPLKKGRSGTLEPVENLPFLDTTSSAA
jgi:hypothetical protein